jgi:hypothetical protein
MVFLHALDTEEGERSRELRGNGLDIEVKGRESGRWVGG